MLHPPPFFLDHPWSNTPCSCKGLRQRLISRKLVTPLGRLQAIHHNFYGGITVNGVITETVHPHSPR